MAEERERRMISEWALDRHPQDIVRFNLPLGAIPANLPQVTSEGKRTGAARPWRLRADAVVICPDRLRIVEAKILSTKSALGDLLLYRPLVDETPELQMYMPRTIEMVAVVPWESESIQAIARPLGITIDVFEPDWLEEFLGWRHRYWTREYRQAREAKNLMREALGVD